MMMVVLMMMMVMMMLLFPWSRLLYGGGLHRVRARPRGALPRGRGGRMPLAPNHEKNGKGGAAKRVASDQAARDLGTATRAYRGAPGHRPVPAPLACTRSTSEIGVKPILPAQRVALPACIACTESFKLACRRYESGLLDLRPTLAKALFVWLRPARKRRWPRCMRRRQVTKLSRRIPTKMLRALCVWLRPSRKR